MHRLIGGDRYEQLRELSMGIRDNFVKVHEAARILGVSPNTVRKWGASGQIPEYRHPVNRYRLYKRKDLEALLQQIEKSNRSATGRKR